MIYKYLWLLILSGFCFHLAAFSTDENSHHQPESSTIHVVESVYGSYLPHLNLIPMHFRLKKYVFKQNTTSRVLPGDSFYIVDEHRESLPNNSYRIHLDVISIPNNISSTFVSEIITQELYHKIVDIKTSESEQRFYSDSDGGHFYRYRQLILTLEDGTVLHCCDNNSPYSFNPPRRRPNIQVGDYVSLSDFCYAEDQWDPNYEAWVWFRKSSRRTEGVYSNLYEAKGIYNSIQFYHKNNEKMICYFKQSSNDRRDYFIISHGPRSSEEHLITSKVLNSKSPPTIIYDEKPESNNFGEEQ